MPLGRSLTHGWAGLRRVVGLYAQLLDRAVRGHRRAVVVSVVYAGLGGLGQGSLAPLVGYAVHSAQQAGDAGGSALTTLVLMSGLVMIAMSLGAWFTYASVKRARRIARHALVERIGSVIATLAATESVSHRGMPDKPGQMYRLALRDSMQASVAVEAIITVVEPLMRVALSIAVIVWVDASLSLLALPVFALLFPLVYRLVRTIGRDSREYYEKHIIQMWGTVSDRIRGIGASLVPGGDEASCSFPVTPDVETFLDENDRLRLAQSRVQFAVDLLFSLALAAALMLSGYLAVSGRLEWGPALAFLLALVTAIRGGRAVIATTSQLGRLYPAVQRLDGFIGADRDGGGGIEPRWPLVVGAAGEGADLRLVPGMRVGVISDEDVSRMGLRGLLAVLTGDPGGWVGTVSLTGKSFGPPDAPAWEWLGAAGRGACEDAMGRMGVLEEWQELGSRGAGDPAVSMDDWAGMSGSLRLVLACIACRAHPGPVSIIALPLVNGADPASADVALSLLDEKLVFIAGAAYTMPACCGEVVIVTRGGSVLGFGDRAWASTMKHTGAGRADDEVELEM